MITKSDLQKANEKLKAEARRRLGDPPTAEELVAYAKGELAPADAERVRELLVAYPELARAIAEPFPSEGAEPGDDDYLSDAEFAPRWAALRQRMAANGHAAAAIPQRVALSDGRIVRFHRRVELALAAMLVLAFGGYLLEAQANRRIAMKAERLAQPRVMWQEQPLMPDGHRGLSDATLTLSPAGNAYMLAPMLVNADAYAKYRAEMLDTTAKPRQIWNTDALDRRPGDTFAILVPSEFLSSGHRYQLVLYGVDGTAQERLASYTFRAR